MTIGLRRRFWPETVLGMMTTVLFMITLVKRDWIEGLFGIDPDSHNGSLEWLIVGGLVVVTVVLFSLARYEWRRAARVAA